MASRAHLFEHNLRAKKNIPPELLQALPLPVFDGKQSLSGKIDAVFTGFSVDVIDSDSVRELCLHGGFGQCMSSRAFPSCLINDREIHSSKRKRTEKNSNTLSPHSSIPCERQHIDEQPPYEPLCLFLEEAFFLLHQLKILRLKSIDKEDINAAEAFKRFQKIKKGFFGSYCAYLYLKSKNWIIKSGLKFGGDFVIYVKGPQFYHASYIVLIQDMYRGKQLGSHIMDGLNFQGLNRIAETTAKDVLFLEVHYPNLFDPTEGIECLGKIKDVRVSQTFTKHYNYVASRNNNENKSC